MVRLSRNPLRGIFLVLALLLVGCDDDGPTGPGGPGVPLPGETDMQARIDGSQWNATFAVASSAATVGQAVAVSGSSGTTTLAFAFLLQQDVNTYTIGTSVGANAILTIGSGNWRAPAGGTAANPDGTSGSITITNRSSERIAGTFQFVVANSDAPDDLKTITNGLFDVEYGGLP